MIDIENYELDSTTIDFMKDIFLQRIFLFTFYFDDVFCQAIQ